MRVRLMAKAFVGRLLQLLRRQRHSVRGRIMATAFVGRLLQLLAGASGCSLLAGASGLLIKELLAAGVLLVGASVVLVEELLAAGASGSNLLAYGLEV
jgi:hypothetical protein